MAGYILILAILILGGAIATIGDRIGSRVGKARLRLFNLRPRKTATVFTVLTGSTISLLTLAILVATSDQLRDGLFRIESIQRQRRQAEAELSQVQAQKEAIQGDLAEAKTELAAAQTRLARINQSLSRALARQKRTQAQLNQVQAKFQQAQVGLKKFSQQAKQLRSEINRLGAERQRLTAQRNQAQARLRQAEAEQRQLERSVIQAQSNLKAVRAQRDQLERAVSQTRTKLEQAQARLQQAETEQAQLERAVAQAQTSLQQANLQQVELLNQQAKLEAEIASLERNRDRLEQSVRALLLGLRRGNIAIRTGQVLANGVVRDIKDRSSAIQAINQLLREARRTAVGLTKPDQLAPNQQVVTITNSDLEQLIRQISDGRTYAVRLLAVVNYFEGEDQILVIPEAAPNRVVFPAGEQVASISVNPTEMTDDQILERLDYLFAVSNRRAVQSGILRDPLTGTVGSFRQADLIKFILQLRKYQGTINVATVTPETVYTSGPLKLQLVALQNQQVIYRSS